MVQSGGENPHTTDPSDDTPLLILMPFKSYNDILTQMRDSQKTRAGCGHPCWISPDGRAYLAATPNAATVCINCRPPEKETVAQRIVPGGMESLRAELRPESLERLLRRLRFHNISTEES
jgi:hypothetical protein